MTHAPKSSSQLRQRLLWRQRAGGRGMRIAVLASLLAVGAVGARSFDVSGRAEAWLSARTNAGHVAPSGRVPEVKVAGVSIVRSTTTVVASNPTQGRDAGASPQLSQSDADEIPTSSTSAPAPSAEPVTTSAPPTTLTPAPSPPTTAEAQRLQDQIFARISYPWREQLPGWRIEFLSPRAGYRGSTFPREHLIQIYLRDSLTLDDLVHVTAHEIGHAVDVTYLTDTDRARWLTVRGRHAEDPWWASSGLSDFASGSGDWAESFAWSQMPSGKWYSELGSPPSADQITELWAIVDAQ